MNTHNLALALNAYLQSEDAIPACEKQPPFVRGGAAQNGMDSTVSPFETMLSDRYLPLPALK